VFAEKAARVVDGGCEGIDVGPAGFDRRGTARDFGCANRLGGAEQTVCDAATVIVRGSPEECDLGGAIVNEQKQDFPFERPVATGLGGKMVKVYRLHQSSLPATAHWANSHYAVLLGR
jgi:hypothetical protein